MAANPSSEVKAITLRTHDLMLALSNEPLGVAGILLGRGFISGEIMSKMLVVSYTPTEKATILIEAMRNKVELAPSKFPELLEILSDQACAEEVVESLRSAYQSELTSLTHEWTCQSRWVARFKQREGLILHREHEFCTVISDPQCQSPPLLFNVFCSGGGGVCKLTPHLKGCTVLYDYLIYLHLCLPDLFPDPFPAFQCCMLKSGRAWYAKLHAWHNHSVMLHEEII